MIRLPTAAVTALRNRLRDRGVRPSISLPTARASARADMDDVLDALIAEEYAPLCDAMYLMMAADQQLTAAERDVIRGALRELDDRIRTRHVEAMIAASAEALVCEGWDGRLRALSDTIGDDRARADAAILLAAAVAYADGEIAPAENDVMAMLMEALGVDDERMRVLIGSLERVNTVLERDAKVDAADVAVHAALRLRAPEDFERLAATTDRPDVTLVLRLYAAYVRACDDLLDRSVHPRSIPTASVTALGELARALQEGRSERLDELRASLEALVEALERVDRATSLRALSSDAADPLSAIEQALDRLSRLVARALERVGEPTAGSDVPVALRAAVAAVAQGRPGAPDALSQAIDRLLGWAAFTVPGAVLSTVGHVLRGVAALPLETESTAPAKAASEPSLPEWIPQSRVLGGFYVHAPLGDGGAGSVFVVSRAEERDDASAPRYALKVPHYDAVAARSVSEAEYLRVFKLEAGTLLSLPEHPNLAEFITFDARARPKPLLVMELVEGTDCLELLKKRELDCARVITILDGALSGLSAMHEAGVGHLDVKPSNIVLRRGGAPALVDFGLAGRHLRVGCATPMYASPEVWGHVEEGAPATPFSADVYSFGCVAFELLTGKMLFEGSHVLALMAAHFEHDGKPEAIARWMADPALSSIATWLSSCLRRSPAARPTVDALQAQLREIAPRLSAMKWPLPAA
ncbi:MAG: serine/threonine protein kinase [Deltaproteobacteria bacterium]|nr:serine/threonine protein kinase [Deltaproteobacteria bacterium]